MKIQAIVVYINTFLGTLMHLDKIKKKSIPIMYTLELLLADNNLLNHNIIQVQLDNGHTSS